MLGFTIVKKSILVDNQIRVAYLNDVIAKLKLTVKAQQDELNKKTLSRDKNGRFISKKNNNKND